MSNEHSAAEGKGKQISDLEAHLRFISQSILKISPGISLEGMMLKKKLQYFGHLMEEMTHWKRL